MGTANCTRRNQLGQRGARSHVEERLIGSATMNHHQKTVIAIRPLDGRPRPVELSFMGTLKQDFRYGLRMLRKSRGFTAVAVITLALAIGANTAIFSVLYPALLRPLPYQQPDRLVTLGEHRAQEPCCSYGSSSYPDYLDWKQSAKSFAALAGFADDSFVLTGNGDPKTIYAAMVTPNFFSTLGVNLLLGRDLVADGLA